MTNGTTPLYLDLFSDTISRENFIFAIEKAEESPETLKFSEVYKNNLQ